MGGRTLDQFQSRQKAKGKDSKDAKELSTSTRGTTSDQEKKKS